MTKKPEDPSREIGLRMSLVDTVNRIERMSDTKSANRRPSASSASEGIYIVDREYACALICTVCGRGGLSTMPIVKASHAKKHVREGTVIRREETGYDGPRSVWEAVPADPAEDTLLGGFEESI